MNTPAFHVRQPNGAHLAYCTKQHAQRWLLAALYSHRGSALTADSPEPDPAFPVCAHCAWCGVQVVDAGPYCLAHNMGCPTWTPAGTLAFTRAIEQLTAATGHAPDDDTRSYLDDAAHGQHEAGVFPKLADLVAAVLTR